MADTTVAKENFLTVTILFVFAENICLVIIIKKIWLLQKYILVVFFARVSTVCSPVLFA